MARKTLKTTKKKPAAKKVAKPAPKAKAKKPVQQELPMARPRYVRQEFPKELADRLLNKGRSRSFFDGERIAVHI
jgi:hypothetical protein